MNSCWPVPRNPINMPRQADAHLTGRGPVAQDLAGSCRQQEAGEASGCSSPSGSAPPPVAVLPGAALGSGLITSEVSRDWISLGSSTACLLK